jgi:ankyrin repeat protein
MAKLRRSDTRKKARRDYRKTRRAAKKVGGIFGFSKKKHKLNITGLNDVTDSFFSLPNKQKNRERELINKVETDNIHSMKDLLSKKVSPNIITISEDGTIKTPLLMAIGAGNVEMVKLLIRHHANPNIPSIPPQTPLHTFDDKNEKFKRMLDDATEPYTPIRIVEKIIETIKNNTEKKKYKQIRAVLLDPKLSVKRNIPIANNDPTPNAIITPTSNAINTPTPNATNTSIPNAANNSTHSPTIYTIPNINMKSIHNDTMSALLIRAAKNNNLERVRTYLIEKQADPNVMETTNLTREIIRVDGSVVTPLIYAIKHSNPTMVDTLLTQGKIKADPLYPCNHPSISTALGKAVKCPEKIAKDIHEQSPTHASKEVLDLLNKAINAHFNEANKK